MRYHDRFHYFPAVERGEHLGIVQGELAHVFLAGVAGALWLSYFGSVDFTAGTGYEFTVIAAVPPAKVPPAWVRPVAPTVTAFPAWVIVPA